MRIYIIRHGESTGDIDDIYGGDYNDHLTSKGKKQSLALAKKLKKSHIKIIYHSPLFRAKETAEIVARHLHIPLKEVYELKERNNYGILTGLKKSEGMKKYPEEAKKILKSKTFHDVKGSESYDAFKKRIKVVFAKLLKSKHDTIALFTHGGPLSLIARELLKIGEISYEDCAYMVIDNKLNVLEMSGITKK